MSVNPKELIKLITIFQHNLEDEVGPEYRGAPYPPFDPLHINTKRIPDGMRPKYVHVDADEKAGIFKMYWQTQESFNGEDFDKFIEEIKRCVDYQLSFYNLDLSKVDLKQVVLEVVAESRDGRRYGEGYKELIFEPDTILESLDTEDIYYYGFIGGDAGNYFDGDYFKVYRNNDNTYSWVDSEETYSANGKKFKSRRIAASDAIKTIKPDDGSTFVVRRDPDEVFKLVYPDKEDIDIPEDIL